MVKKRLEENDFYLAILNELKQTTNLTKISKKLNLSKQALNYYIKTLRRNKAIIKLGKGHYELIDSSKNPSKNSTVYGSKNMTLLPDTIRGHAFIWDINLPKKIIGWDKRIDILNSKKINYKLIGPLKNIPRIKILGRKVWLCNTHVKIFEPRNTSFYGNNAPESKRKAFIGLLEMISALESKLGFIFRPLDFYIKKEHYALIKNDLAIEHNKKGIILRISDNSGEWLLIDDSLGEGGELETIGKSAFNTNIQLQKWWNEQKETNFKVTPTFLMESINKLTNLTAQNQIQLLDYTKQNASHLDLIKDYRKESELRRKAYKNILDENINLKKIIKEKNQTKLTDFTTL